MASIKRADILAKFNEMAARRQPIIGGGAGTGLSAKCEEAGGIDLIIIYNSGRYRMAGRGSSSGLMAYGNANAIVKEMALEILPVAKRTPVLAGVNGTDPFLIMPVFLRELKELGFSGVQNFPTVGIIDGNFRVMLEETGIQYAQEIDILHLASEMVVDAVIQPEDLRAELVRRFSLYAGRARGWPAKHNAVTPV